MKQSKRILKRDLVLKEIFENRNHSWYEEITTRNKSNLNRTAISYWDIDVTYERFFEEINKYARALCKIGINRGDEFIACVRQMPDYPIIFGAASLTGSYVAFMAPEFDPAYIKQVIEQSSKKIIFVNDWDLATIVDSLIASEIQRVVVIPMNRWGCDPHKDVSERFYKFNVNEYEEAYKKLDNVCLINEFLAEGTDFEGEINRHGTLDDVVAITYSSGSTKKGFHKGIPQRNATYIIMGRYHDHEVAGIPEMKDTRTYVGVGTQADTLLLTGVSDTMMQGGVVVLDPIIDEYYFLFSLLFYRAGLVVATRTTFLRAMEETYTNPEFKGITLPYLYVPSEGGEPMSAGEEKALNRWLKRVKAGTKITHTPFSIVKMSIGGGDSEHGSLFLTLFRGYYDLLQKIRGIQEPIGMEYYDFADVKALRDDGSYCNPMELGRLVANSPISMKHYHHDEDATNRYFITDKNGITWGDLGTYGYIDKWERVYVKARIFSDDPEIKQFQISDVILQDSRNILSCEVLYFCENDRLNYVAHIEFQKDKIVNEKATLKSLSRRIKKEFGNRLDNKLFIRIRDHNESFPTLFTAKRNLHALREEGISSKCIPLERLF